jgi:hypothetical protein
VEPALVDDHRGRLHRERHDRRCDHCFSEALAAAYVDGRTLPAIKVLAEKTIHGKGSQRLAKASCQVSLIARPVAASTATTTFAWERPAAEIARSTGGPLISCAAATK